MMSDSKIKFYVDTIILEAAFSNNFVKNAEDSQSTDMIEAAKNYFNQHLTPGHTTESFLRLLSPGITFTAFSAFGFPWLGAAFALLQSVFHTDLIGIFSSIYDGIQSLISGGKQTSSAEVERVVKESVDQHTPTPTEQDVPAIVEKIEKAPGATTTAPSTPQSSTPTSTPDVEESDAGESLESLISENSKSFKSHLREANLLKLAIIEFENNNYIIKEAGILSSLLSRLGSLKNLLIKALSWFFRIGLASAGFMVAGDAINYILGRPNAFSGTLQSGTSGTSGTGGFLDLFNMNSNQPKQEGSKTTPVAADVSRAKQTTSQKLFKVNSGYSDFKFNDSKESLWVLTTYPTQNNIEDIILDYAVEVYPGLKGKEDIITSTEGFRKVIEVIMSHNTNSGIKMLYIPFETKKQIADFFIDEVAEKMKK